MASVSELDAQINQLSQEQQSLVRRNSDLGAMIATEQASYQSWVAVGNYDEAHRHSDAVDMFDAERNGNNARLAVIAQLLPIYQSQKQSLIDAQNAANAQANAEAALTQAQSNLSPEQLFQLQLEQIQSASEERKAAAAAKIAAALTAQKAADAKAATNKKYLLFGVIGIVLIVGGVLIVKYLK